MSRTGRRPGDSSVTREEILLAARATFSEMGYETATLRKIATAAGVDASLIVHYFGSKERLFAATHDLPIDPEAVAAVFSDGPEDEIGVRVARFAFGNLTTDGSPAISLIRAASTNAAAAAMLREFVDRAMIGPIAALIDAPDSRRRVALVASQVLGVLFARHIVGLEEMTAASVDDLVDAMAPSFQRHLTVAVEPLPTGI